MTAILCLALLGQIRTIEDGSFAYAVENTLADWQSKPAFLSSLVPEPVASRVMLLGNAEYRFCRLAYNDLKGEQFVPSLIVGLRLKDAEIRTLCRRLLLEELICPTCCGQRRCFRFVQGADPYDCEKCGLGRWQHDRSSCSLCHGAGYLIDLADWPEPRPFVAQD